MHVHEEAQQPLTQFSNVDDGESDCRPTTILLPHEDMSAANPPVLSIAQAYRHLYRGLLHAVQYSAPARYVVRDQIREAFRKGEPATFDQAKVSRTLVFLQGAARERGLEHRVLKNLVHTAYWRREDRIRLVTFSTFLNFS